MLLARCCGSVKKRKVVVGKMDKIRVFLADASEDYLTYMRAELVSGGFEVVGTATDGRAALAGLREQGADVLLCDILLPGLDGFALAEAARDAGLGCAVVFLSAFLSSATARRAGAVGAADYLMKPCDIGYLLRRLREAVVGAKPRRDCAPEVAAALRAFGIPPHLTGYAFLAEALMRAAEDRTWLRGVTKVLYPGLAEQFASTPECVERAIRVAVEKAWIPRNEQRRRAYFDDAFDSFDKAPTNARFLAIVTEVIDEKTLWEN